MHEMWLKTTNLTKRVKYTSFVVMMIYNNAISNFFHTVSLAGMALVQRQQRVDKCGETGQRQKNTGSSYQKTRQVRGKLDKEKRRLSSSY